MYYYFRDYNGVDPLDIQIIKLIERDEEEIKVCGCQFSFTDGKLELLKRRFCRYPSTDLIGDYFLDEFSALHFDTFNRENFSVLGLEDFPLDQLDPSVFDVTPETVFKALN